MGDILARTMSQRARQAGAGDNAAAPPPNATPARPAAPRARPTTRLLADGRLGSRGRSLPTPAASSTRRLTPRPLPPRASATGPLRGTHSPARPSDTLDAPAATSATPQPGVARLRPADAAESIPAGERILELPPQRTTTGRATGPLNPENQSRGVVTSSAPLTASAQPGPKPARPLGQRVHEDAADYTANGASGTVGAAQISIDPNVCPICGGAGYVRLDLALGDPGFGRPVPCECKERQNRERRQRELQQKSSLEPFRNKTLETFDAEIPGMQEVFEVVRKYAADPAAERWQWLVLSGPHGVGKTHLAAAVAHRQLAHGAPVFFSIVPDLLDHLRAAFAPSSDVTYDELFDRIREVELLVLDDLGAENSTAWASEKLFQLINYRYNMRIPTVITTNRHLLSQMDERIRSRLSDIGLVRHVAIKAQDYRERHVERRQRTTAAPRPGSGQSTRR